MKRQEYITEKENYKLHMVAMQPDAPQRIILIPPLVGAKGILEIQTFRYFLREGCLIISFDYSGHYFEINRNFTIEHAFKDTRIALLHAIERSRDLDLPLHAIGTCFGLIPLLNALNQMGWPRQIKSFFSVNGLLGMNDLLNFDSYKLFLAKRGLLFQTKSEFIRHLLTDKKGIMENKQVYIDAMSDYLVSVFPEMSNIISNKNFGILDYERADFHKTFYEFLTLNITGITVPDDFPCLFFTGNQDSVLNLKEKNKKIEYTEKIIQIAPHAKILNINIDHFGRGDDHYAIGEEGIKFLTNNENRAKYISSCQMTATEKLILQ